jgi:hypothetical protein
MGRSLREARPVSELGDSLMTRATCRRGPAIYVSGLLPPSENPQSSWDDTAGSPFAALSVYSATKSTS